jgi:serine protease Do
MSTRARSFSILVLALCVASAASANAQTVSTDQQLNPGIRSPFSLVADEVMPAVVSITARKPFDHPPIDGDMFRFFPRGRDLGRDTVPGAGSGFVITDDGYVLTNNHVIAEATEIEVLLPGRDEGHPATIVGQDPSTDLALLKIDTKGEKLPFLRFADSDEVSVGDYAIAIGNPLGQLAGSLTVGVISAKGRSDLQIQGGTPRYQDFMQTDAAINFGNSGGPLVDIHGRVIGVNTAINAAGQNIGFTIPSNLALNVTRQLRESGRVVRGFLGVNMSALTREIAEGRDLEITQGVIVERVLENTPASRGGLIAGDIIAEFNGDPVRNERDLQWKVADSPVGEEALVVIYREGRRQEVKVVLDEYKEEVATLAGTPSRSDASRSEDEIWLGLGVTSLDDRRDPRVQELVDMYDIRGTKGALVVTVEAGSAADLARLRPGDVIFEVVDRPIDTLADFREAARQFRDRTRMIAIGFRRGEMTSYVSIDPLAGPENE